MSMKTVRMGAEGRERPVTVQAAEDETLLAVLRGALQAKSVVRGCKNGSCGSCRVLVDGSLVSSCLVPFRDVPEGARIETYEDLAGDDAAIAAVTHFEDERTSRCKLCVAGLGVAAVHLVRTGGAEKEAAIEQTAAGAHCQCTGRASLRRSLAFVRPKPRDSGTSGA